MALICHHPHLFWLTFPLTDWGEALKGASESAVITLFSHTAGGRLTTTPKSNLDNLLPTFDRGEKWAGLGSLVIAACWMLFAVELPFRRLLSSCVCVAQTLLRLGAQLFLAYFSVTCGAVERAGFPAASVCVTGACEPQTLWPQDHDLRPFNGTMAELWAWPPVKQSTLFLSFICSVFPVTRSISFSLSLSLRGSGHSANERSYLRRAPGP